MHAFQKDFLDLALAHEVLRFGEFTLKSGRVSPYFFNLGRISTGAAMARLGAAYAGALEASGLEYDALFGPAYKGIPLVTAVSCALAGRGRDVPFSYNRKETKDHGEGGLIVGSLPKARVVLIDDVLTAGTALREAIALLKANGATPVGALIALDRQEVGPEGRSAVAEIEAASGIRVVPLVTVKDVMAFMAERPDLAATLPLMQDYQRRYGVNSL